MNKSDYLLLSRALASVKPLASERAEVHFQHQRTVKTLADALAGLT